MNLIKDKNHIVNSIYAEQNFNKFQHLLMIKAPTSLGNSIPQYNKGYIWQIHNQCFKHLDKNKDILKTYSYASFFWLSEYLNNFILGEGKHWKLLSIRGRDLTQFQQLSNHLSRETWNPDNDGAMTGMPTSWQVLLTNAYLFLSAKLHV